MLILFIITFAEHPTSRNLDNDVDACWMLGNNNISHTSCPSKRINNLFNHPNLITKNFISIIQLASKWRRLIRGSRSFMTFDFDFNKAVTSNTAFSSKSPQASQQYNVPQIFLSHENLLEFFSVFTTSNFEIRNTAIAVNAFFSVKSSKSSSCGFIHLHCSNRSSYEHDQW